MTIYDVLLRSNNGKATEPVIVVVTPVFGRIVTVLTALAPGISLITIGKFLRGMLHQQVRILPLHLHLLT